jgi:GNAT superfamily N-acetyltransferase
MIECRAYRPADRDACLALFDANCPAFFAENERADYAGFLASAPGQYEVCLIDGRVAGAYGLGPHESGELALRWILLSPETQGRGVGSAIMHRVIEEMRGRGVHRLHIAASQKSAPFFARFGARELATTLDGWGSGMVRVDMRLDDEDADD